MPFTTTQQAAIDVRSDELAVAVEVAREQLAAARREARHYRRWDVPDHIRAAIKKAERHLEVAEGALREHGERHRIGRAIRTGRLVFEKGER